MKKYIILSIAILTLMFAPSLMTSAGAQDALFKKYENSKGVTTVFISKSMLKLVSSFEKSDVDFSKISNRLDHVRILSCERPSVISEIKKDAVDYFNKNKYEVAMQVNEDGERTTIYMKEHGRDKREFVLLAVEKDEISIINILGNITIKDIQAIK